MIHRLQALLLEAQDLESDAEAKDVAVGLIRISLQHACISLAEWVVHKRLTSDKNVEQRHPLPLDVLRAPSDGSMVAALGELLVAAENEGWAGVSRPFWRTLTRDRPAYRFVTGKTVN